MMPGTAGQLRNGNKSSGAWIASKLGYSVLYIVLSVVAILQIFPLVWLLFFSLKNNQEVFNLPPLSLPMNPRWENYEKVWSAGNIDVYFFNSVWITVVATVLTIVLGSLVTYAITRLKWKEVLLYSVYSWLR